MKEKVDKLYQKLSYTLVKRAISISMIFAMLIPHFATPISYAMGMVSSIITESQSSNEENVEDTKSDTKSDITNDNGSVTTEKEKEKEIDDAEERMPEDILKVLERFLSQINSNSRFNLNSAPVHEVYEARAEFEEENQSVMDIKTGATHTLLLKEDGTVWAWGQNSNGQLGQGDTTTTSTEPLQVKDSTGEGYLQNIIAISTTYSHNLALDKDGTVWAWGAGSNGRLGNGTTTASITLPVKVLKGAQDVEGNYLSDIVEISAGNNASMARTSTGTVYTWGLNGNGQLGDNSTTQRTTPVTNGITNAISISMGNVNAFAVLADGAVRSWGYNASGANGNASTATTNVLVPTAPRGVNNVATVPLSNMKKIVATNAGAMVLDNDGYVYMWGIGVPGDGTTVTKTYPVQVKNIDNSGPLENIVEIAGGFSRHAIDSNGKVYGWAQNTYGELADGTVTARNNPVLALDEDGQPIENIYRVVVNNTTYNVMYLTKDGEILSSGANNAYNIAGTNEGSYNKNAIRAFRPEIYSTDNNTRLEIGKTFKIETTYISGFKAEGTDVKGTLAYTSSDTSILTVNGDGVVTGTGYGKAYVNISNNQNNLHTRVYVDVINTNDITIPMTGVGVDFSVVLRADGTVWAWGVNTYGQLGTGITNPAVSPVQVVAGEQGEGYLKDIVKISVGDTHVLALDINGNVYAWGENTGGKLGQGDTVARSVPTKVKGVNGVDYLENIVDIAAGENNSFALGKDGTVYAAGANTSGSLGDFTGAAKTYMIKVPTNKSYKVFAAYRQAFFMRNNGMVFSTGLNTTGMLGDNTTTARTSTVGVQGLGGTAALLRNVKEVATGINHANFLIENGDVYSVGTNTNGTLGNGNATNSQVLIKSILSNIAHIYNNPVGLRALGYDGKLYVAGSNDSGKLSVGNVTVASVAPYQTAQSPFPALEKANTPIEDVLTVSNVSATTSAIGSHSVLIKKDGSIWTVGKNTEGTLGLGHKTATVAATAYYTQIAQTELVANKGDLIIKQGATAGISANIVGMNAFWSRTAAGNLEYESVDTSIATVNNTGVVSGIQVGQTVIIVKDVTNNLETRVKVSITNNKANTITLPQIVTGAAHTVALKEDGTVWAWGQGSSGQLGIDVTRSATRPEQVIGVDGTGYLENIIKIAAGSNHTLALDKDGNVYSFGLNSNGQLGLGDVTLRNRPTKVSRLKDIVDIFAGGNNSFAMDKYGNVYGFGQNTYYQLGDVSAIDRNLPSIINGKLFNAIDIKPMISSTIALRPDGTLVGIGRNNVGELGVGNTTAVSTAGFTTVRNSTNTEELKDIIEIVAGEYHVVALDKDKNVWSWGQGANGKLGDGGTTNRSLPVKVIKGTGETDGLTGIKHIKAGANSSYAIAVDGKTYAWGDNTYGRLGIGNTTASQPAPVIVKALDGVTDFTDILDITGGTNYSAILAKSGYIYGAGRSDVGQLGNGTAGINTVNQITPIVTGLKIGLTTGNTVIKKGNNKTIGVGITESLNLYNNNNITINANITSVDESIATVSGNTITGVEEGITSLKIEDTNLKYIGYIPVSVLNDTADNAMAVPDIKAGKDFTVMLKADGTVWTWGSNANGELGIGSTTASTEPKKVLENIVKIDVGTSFVLALDIDGTVWAWGLNTSSQLGVGDAVNRLSPTKMRYLGGVLENIDDIAAGTTGSVAKDASGMIYGNGIIQTAAITTTITGQTGVKKVYLNLNSFLMLKNNGEVWGIGLNTSGQLGDASITTRTAFVKMSGNLNIKEMIAGANHTVILDTDGKVWVVGANTYGQLGQGNTTAVAAATAIPRAVLYSGNQIIAKKVFAGANSSYALLEDGTILSWGLNTSGELGVNNFANQTSPTLMRDEYAEGNFTNGFVVNGGIDGTHTMILDAKGRVYTTGSNDVNNKAGDYKTTILTKSKPVQIFRESLQSDDLVQRIQKGRVKDLNVYLKRGLNAYGNVRLSLGALTYTSANTDVATVNSAGLVEAKEKGVTYITVRDNSNNLDLIVRVEVTGANEITTPKILSGDKFTVALKADGTVWASGSNGSGQLGQGNTLQQTSFVEVKKDADTMLTDIVEIAVGQNHILALDKDGSVWSWGLNASGQLGNGTNTGNSQFAVKVAGLEDIKTIGAGALNSFAVNNNGELYAWGANTNGILGNGTTTAYYVPTKIPMIDNVSKIQGSDTFTIALKTDGTVWSWGINTNYYLGDNTTTARTTPVITRFASEVGTLKNVADIKVGYQHTLALKTDGTVFGWGYNSVSELGTNNTTRVQIPTNLGLTDISSIGATYNASYVVDKNGVIYASGNNSNYQQSNGTITKNTVFTRMQDEKLANIESIDYVSSGTYGLFTFAIKKTGEVWAVRTKCKWATRNR